MAFVLPRRIWSGMRLGVRLCPWTCVVVFLGTTWKASCSTNFCSSPSRSIPTEPHFDTDVRSNCVVWDDDFEHDFTNATIRTFGRPHCHVMRCLFWVLYKCHVKSSNFLVKKKSILYFSKFVWDYDSTGLRILCVYKSKGNENSESYCEFCPDFNHNWPLAHGEKIGVVWYVFVVHPIAGHSGPSLSQCIRYAEPRVRHEYVVLLYPRIVGRYWSWLARYMVRPLFFCLMTQDLYCVLFRSLKVL